MRNTDPKRLFDGLLVEQYLDGDAKAMDLLIKRWNKRVLSYAFRMVKESESAKDITQEVWITAIKKMKHLQEPSKVGSWLLSITHNKCVDLVRRSIKTRQLILHQELDTEMPDDENSQQLKLLRRAIRGLSENHSVVLNLFYLEGMSLIEISEILNISKGTVKSRLFHAREQLKNTLK